VPPYLKRMETDMANKHKKPKQLGMVTVTYLKNGLEYSFSCDASMAEDMVKSVRKLGGASARISHSYSKRGEQIR